MLPKIIFLGIEAENTIEKSVALNESTYNYSMGLDRKRSVLSRIRSKFKSRAGKISSRFTDSVDLDKILVFFAESNKLLNSHTKNSRINELTRTFNNFYESPGALNFAIMINMWSSWATIFDATANFIRVNEVRFIAANENKTATSSTDLEDVRLLLNETNSNLADASDLIEAVACDSEAGCTTRSDINQPAFQAEHSDLQNEAYLIQFNDKDSGSEQTNSYSVEKVQKTPQPPPVSPQGQTRQLKQDISPTNIRRINPNRQSYHETNRRFHLPAVNYGSTPVHSRRRNKRRILPADYYTSRLVGWLNTAHQYLNYNSNHTHFDKFMRAFVDTMNTPGYLAMDTFTTMISTLWTVIDAATNVWRFSELRLRDGILWNQINSFPDPLTEFQSELEDANSNIDDFSSLVNGLPCDFDADIEDIPVGCFTQNIEIQAANARVDKGSTSGMYYVPPVGYKAKNRRKNRRKHRRNNLTERKKQSTPIHHESDQVKINLNNRRQESIKKTRQNSPAVNQQAINHVDSSRIDEAVRQFYTINQDSNPTDTRRINPQPNIETNRNFLYPAATYYNRPAHSRSRTKRKIIPDDYYIGKFTNWTNTANNNLNSNSNNRKLNRFMSSFNYLFSSPGFYSINLFYTIIQSLWTVADAAGNIVRINGIRISNELDQKRDASTPDPLEELQSILNETNLNLQEFLKLANGLPCDLNADAEESLVGCLAQNNGIEAVNSSARKGSINFRTVDRRNNLMERNMQSNAQKNRRKFYPSNSRHAAVKASPPVNIQPSIHPSRHFYYKLNYSNNTSNNTQHKFQLLSANRSHPIETGRGSNVPNNYPAIRHIYSTSQSGSSVVDAHSSLVQTRRHSTSATENSNPVNDRQIPSQASTGVYRNLYYPVRYGNSPTNHHQKHPHQRSKVGINHRSYPVLNQKLIRNRWINLPRLSSISEPNRRIDSNQRNLLSIVRQWYRKSRLGIQQPKPN